MPARDGQSSRTPGQQRHQLAEVQVSSTREAREGRKESGYRNTPLRPARQNADSRYPLLTNPLRTVRKPQHPHRTGCAEDQPDGINVDGCERLFVDIARHGADRRKRHPGEIQLAESSGSTSLDEAALTALRRWRFQPALRNGQAVLAWVIVPVIFSLR